MNTLSFKAYIAAFALLALVPLTASQTPLLVNQAMAKNVMDENHSSGYGGNNSPVDGDIAQKMDRSTTPHKAVKNKERVTNSTHDYQNSQLRGYY